jgi:hypothetical protein
MMETRSLDRILIKPIVLFSGLIIALTFLSHVTGRPETDWSRSQFFLWAFDLTSKGNLAMWFEVMLFAANGMVFLSLGFGISDHMKRYRHLGFLLKLIAVVLLFLSADEMLAIHKGLGKRLDYFLETVTHTTIDSTGITWLLIYIPAGTVVFFMSLYLFANLVTLIPESAGIRNRIKMLLFVTGGSIVCVVILEVVEKLSGAFRPGGSILACFEESFEISALISLYVAGVLIREGISHRLSATGQNRQPLTGSGHGQ